MLQPLTINLAGTAAAALRPGQTLQAVVQQGRDGLALLLAGTRVALPAGASLVPGQAVTVEIVQTQPALSIRVTPQAPALPESTAAALASALQAMGSLRTAAESLYPALLPKSPESLHTLLSALLNRGSAGQDLGWLAQTAAQAANAGALPPGLAAAWSALAALMNAATPGEFKALLQRATAQRGMEARLAAALEHGTLAALLDEIGDEARTLVERLRQDSAFQSFLRGRGLHASFEDAAQRVLERFTGAGMQNARGLESPYLFFDLPLPPEGPIRHAQIHLFGDGNGPAAFELATVAFDLDTTRLGELWITLRAAPGYCACHFRAREDTAIHEIEAAAPELSEALRAVGYARPQVTVSAWNGDRLDALNGLMRRFDGLDVAT